MAEAARLRREVEVGRAASRRHHPGAGGWCAGLSDTTEDLDDDHAAAAAWAWRPWIGRRGGFSRLARCWGGEQVPGACDIGLATGAGEQAVVPDAVEAFGFLVPPGIHDLASTTCR